MFSVYEMNESGKRTEIKSKKTIVTIKNRRRWKNDTWTQRK